MRRTSMSWTFCMYALLLSLSACAGHRPPAVTGAQVAVHRSAAPAARQRSAPAEKAPRMPEHPAPKKRDHDIEED